MNPFYILPFSQYLQPSTFDVWHTSMDGSCPHIFSGVEELLRLLYTWESEHGVEMAFVSNPTHMPSPGQSWWTCQCKCHRSSEQAGRMIAFQRFPVIKAFTGNFVKRKQEPCKPMWKNKNALVVHFLIEITLNQVLRQLSAKCLSVIPTSLRSLIKTMEGSSRVIHYWAIE